MAQVIRSRLLEYEKSEFLIELMEHQLGDRYISVTQTIKSTNQTEQKLRINPAYLEELLGAISAIYKDEQKIDAGIRKKLTKPDVINALIKNYLKGVNMNSLALIYDSSEEEIEALLRMNDIPIVDQKPPITTNEKRVRRSRY